MREKETIRRKIVVWFTVRSAHGPLFGRAVAPYRRDQEGLHDSVLFRASPLSWRGNPPDERYRGTTSLAPRIYEGGGPRSGRGSSPPQRGKPPQSRLRRASSPRGEAEGASRRSCPPAFMRGEGHAVAGGVPRRSGDGPSQPRVAPVLNSDFRGIRHKKFPRFQYGNGEKSLLTASPAWF